MTDTKKRILVAAAMFGVVLLVGVLQYFGLPAVRFAGIAVVVMMIIEMISMMSRNRAMLPQNYNAWICGGFLVWLVVMLIAVNVVGARTGLMLLLLIVICAADTGAWFFGRVFGGDKMWERISANKTWAGQIAGVICGTVAAVLFSLIIEDKFLPWLMWIGMSVSLLSQYGDLTASWIKRRMGIKDFGNILPGHGGVIDRFDGWIYALPLIWLVMM
ncbi:CDP-archaeol synthase [bacterium]|nr:CDP-archaeol synthase [bacterium]